MNTKQISLIFLLSLLAVAILLSMQTVAAQVSGDWNISGDWSQPTPSPTPSPSPNPTVLNVFNNVYAAILLFSIVGVICVVSAVFLFVKGDGDMEEVGKVAAILILIGIGCFVAVIVSFAMQNAINI